LGIGLGSIEDKDIIMNIGIKNKAK